MPPKQYPVVCNPEFSEELKEFAGEHADELYKSIQWTLMRRPKHGKPLPDGLRVFPVTLSESSALVYYELDETAVHLLSLSLRSDQSD